MSRDGKLDAGVAANSSLFARSMGAVGRSEKIHHGVGQCLLNRFARERHPVSFPAVVPVSVHDLVGRKRIAIRAFVLVRNIKRGLRNAFGL